MKEATPEQFKLFRRRRNITLIVSLCLGVFWLLGLAWIDMNNIFDMGAGTLIGSGIAVYAIQVTFSFVYFHCSACEQPFPHFNRYWPRCCNKCEINYFTSFRTY